MLKRFYPGAYWKSAYEIPFERLYEKGYRGIIFDVDNTLVPHGAPADEKALELFDRLRRIGFLTCILSNNKEPRVQPFAASVKSPYLYKGGKPRIRGYQKAMELMGTKREQTLFVGDQLFTDVWGANRAGIFSILTKPIDPREEIQIVLKRFLEAVVLFFYQRWRQNYKKQLKSDGL
ncbi:MAG: YqeG family HAD IIIA-type phosphatase [Lachnospiraceae bacterium]|nr:YqeG family HAD IIIA-type phosphatase [Lachnospiraceae bacterium]